MKLRRTKAIATIPKPISARAADKATHVPTPSLSGSSSIEALEVALAKGLAVELAAALALAVALAESAFCAPRNILEALLRLPAYQWTTGELLAQSRSLKAYF